MFHSNNRKANKKLNVVMNGVVLPIENILKYHDIKLDRALIFKQQLEGVDSKIKIRNNKIISLVN